MFATKYQPLRIGVNKLMSDNTNSQPKSKKPKSTLKKLFLGFIVVPLIVIIGLALIAGIIGGIKGVQNTKKQPTKQAQTQTVAEQAHFGTIVSDAGFNFVVNSFKCGETHISISGAVYFYSDAQGQYCRLNVTVSNTGNSANSITAYDQHVFNSQGQKYDYASDATAAASGNYAGTPLNKDVNPGNSITGDIIFNVPKGVTPTKAELHGSGSSKGVSVNLQ